MNAQEQETQERELTRFRVWLRTKGGFYAQYSGKVDVYAENEHEAVEVAITNLQQGAFKDYGRDFWKITKVETLPYY